MTTYVFGKKSTEKKMYVQLSDGRIIPFEDLIMDYERLLKEEFLKFEPITSLKVGEWFLIDRMVIDKNKEVICRKCNKAGTKGKALWKRFEKSNKIADGNPARYPRLIETYIFDHDWDYKTEQEMQDMCEDVGDGMCCEVICDLELQMRICNGESVDDLVKKADKLPCVRVIKFRNGGIGYFGGAAYEDYSSPADIYRGDCFPDVKTCKYTPYAFRLGIRSTEHCFELLKPKQN